MAKSYRVKVAHGAYEIYYRCWKVSFPYWSHNYIFFGTKADATEFAHRLGKRDRIPYHAKIKELHL